MATLVNKNSKDSKTRFKRNWKWYSPQVAAETVESNVSKMSNQFVNLNVQEQWNELEHALIESADQVASLVEQGQARVAKPCQPVGVIKRKINRRKRLLRANRLNHSSALATEIKLLNKDIRSYFACKGRNKIRSIAAGAIGNTGLWKAVKIAKNLNSNEYPENMSLRGFPVWS